jgi:hypothetical protein
MMAAMNQMIRDAGKASDTYYAMLGIGTVLRTANITKVVTKRTPLWIES